MKVNLLGASIDGIDMQETVKRVAGFVKSGKPHLIITLNPEYLFRAQFQPRLMEVVNRADLVTPDGVGIVWACEVAKHPVPERVTGIDLMLSLVERAAREGWRVFLLGSAPGVAAEAAQKLIEKHPGLQVAGTHHGYFAPEEEPEVLEKIKGARPDLLFVALGAPRQELWIEANRQTLGVPVAMGVGGSFDVIAGRVPRAPLWLQRLKLEWLGRLIKEPRRWRRMLVLPKFAWMVIKRYKLLKST
ncbi:WecB/TagA/CpsF family glycosyltransferase [Desulfolucanica intricata]|uniref:WecB/TagA/CpsF family glycosyltransferase n=1 Tax=Desulfolucanica intricata TaxID=1285191 RepID=UPI000832B79B|nr:WecB/TagA/CpsF family glycosyltransferase [Desulfolucanica intricata]